MPVRPEIPADAPLIRALIREAFRDAPRASGAEAEIVDALRSDGALALSLVAVEGEALVGHAAFSPVRVAGADVGWFGLGPLAVRRDGRRRGVGARLVEAGLAALRERGANGCVVLGAPAYYGRFGFAADPTLTLPGVPGPYFQALCFRGTRPAGAVDYHRAFGAG